MILFPVMSSLMGTGGRRTLIQVFPDPMREWWDQWEIRGLVMISIASQVILTILGNQRKFGVNKVTESIIWIAYMVADKVPTIALGVISSKLGSYYDEHGQLIQDLQLIAFWAPFFLMHLGGPDTITAYQLEDNELWLRHLVGLVVQTLLTLYIILLSWDSTCWLSYLSLPILIIGCVKYGEKAWSLYSASTSYGGDQLLSSYVSKSEEITSEEAIGCIPFKDSLDFNPHLAFRTTLVSLFSDMVLRTKDIEVLKELFSKHFKQYAFDEIRGCLGFVYDAFYTKAFVALSIWGCISRLFTFLSLVVVLALHIIFDTESNKYVRLDRVITYILLVGAITLDFLQTILLVVWSDWTLLVLGKIWPNISFSSGIIGWFREKNIEKKQGWSLMPQCNFLTLLLSEHDKFNISWDSFPVKKLENIHTICFCQASSKLKNMLLDNVVKKSNETIPSQSGPQYKELVKTQRLHWRRFIIENLEFHQSILLWHIVTEVCYLSDENRDAPETADHSRESKRLSDYMFYLLAKQRHMLPIGTGLPSLRDTLVDAIKYEQEKKLSLTLNVSETCKILLQHIPEDTEYAKNHPKGRSVLGYAFMTAHELLARGDMKQTWEFLIDLWIEILNYSATHCRVDRHAHQLRLGGEFITHIWMLHFLFGLLEQFQLTRPIIED